MPEPEMRKPFKSRTDEHFTKSNHLLQHFTWKELEEISDMVYSMKQGSVMQEREMRKTVEDHIVRKYGDRLAAANRAPRIVSELLFNRYAGLFPEPRMTEGMPPGHYFEESAPQEPAPVRIRIRKGDEKKTVPLEDILTPFTASELGKVKEAVLVTLKTSPKDERVTWIMNFLTENCGEKLQKLNEAYKVGPRDVASQIHNEITLIGDRPLVKILDELKKKKED